MWDQLKTAAVGGSVAITWWSFLNPSNPKSPAVKADTAQKKVELLSAEMEKIKDNLKITTAQRNEWAKDYIELADKSKNLDNKRFLCPSLNF